MAVDTRIMRDGRRLPVVAFFGTKGGVGKTTIARQFARLVSMAESSPNVLIVDVDVHNRGMTVEMGQKAIVSCKTIHDYIAGQNASDVEATDISSTFARSPTVASRLLFIPASTPEASQVFEQSARIGSQKLLEILKAVITAAANQYQCDCVVIDCGPIIDPYTAAGAMLADREFIIGQNEPISFSNLQFYPNRIREFYPEFTTSKMKLIVNKVRGWERLKEHQTQDDVFHAIPFTMDIVDISEGLASKNEMQTLMFEDHIAQIVEKTFQADHRELIPSRQALLPDKWGALVDNAERLEQAPAIRNMGKLRLLLPVGLLAVIIGGFLLYAGSNERIRQYNHARAAALTETLKEALAQRPAPAAQDLLSKALIKIEKIDAVDAMILDEALELAKKGGISQVFRPKPDSSPQETGGIAMLLAGIAAAGIGLHYARTRQSFMSVLQGLRKGGTQWMMKEMNSKRSSRKSFDRLLKMAERL